MLNLDFRWKLMIAVLAIGSIVLYSQRYIAEKPEAGFSILLVSVVIILAALIIPEIIERKNKDK
jgi:hypothetical protein